MKHRKNWEEEEVGAEKEAKAEGGQEERTVERIN